MELRKTVSDAQISVHQERETANDQGAMILRLKQQQVEDRKRIQRLLALTQPVVGDITFIQEGSEDAGGALAEQYQVALNNAENAMSKKHSNGILSAQAVASRLQARNEVRMWGETRGGANEGDDFLKYLASSPCTFASSF